MLPPFTKTQSTWMPKEEKREGKREAKREGRYRR
jgi:hypothetical protein